MIRLVLRLTLYPKSALHVLTLTLENDNVESIQTESMNLSAEQKYKAMDRVNLAKQF